MIFDPSHKNGAHALERLANDKIAWLTTVTPGGQPGRHRSGSSGSMARSWCTATISPAEPEHRANPKVSFHLADNGSGGDIVVIQGTARVDPGYPAVPDNPAYLEKYGAWIDSGLGGPDRMAQTYSMPILISPTRGTAFEG